MTKKQREERLAFLRKCHSDYCDQGQQAGESERLMAELGHPCADDYRTLFSIWDGLRYSSGHGEKFVAYRDDKDYVEWGRPNLSVECEPKDWQAHRDVFKGEGACWPGTDWQHYLRYVRACGRLGWPKECDPRLRPGRLSVRTRNVRLVADIYVIMGGRCEIGRSDQYASRRDPDAVPWLTLYDSGEGAPNCSQVLRILGAVRRRLGRWMFEPRTEAEKAFDLAPRALAEKPFQHANVAEVTVTDHAVLVPLVPFGPAGAEACVRIAAVLLKLCEDGYPYAGAVRDWLEKFLIKSALRKYDKQFGYKPEKAKT